MSELNVVNRCHKIMEKMSEFSSYKKTGRIQRKIQVIGIGASTGGPTVIKHILSNISKEFSVPILIVQHILPEFNDRFPKWLANSSKYQVKLALDNEMILPGHAYVAPYGFNMGVNKYGRISIKKIASGNHNTSTVSYLFHSISNVFGPNAIGILLTGMGKDGAAELKLMKDKGAITISQNKESSVVFGMPGEAVKLDASNFVLPPDGIVSYLHTLEN